MNELLIASMKNVDLFDMNSKELRVTNCFYEKCRCLRHEFKGIDYADICCVLRFYNLTSNASNMSQFNFV